MPLGAERGASKVMNWLRSLLGFFYDVFFGCRHTRLTRPFTLEQETYKVCLDCGHKVYYSRERMMPLSAREVRRMKAAHSGGLVLAPEPVPMAQAGLLIPQTAGKNPRSLSARCA